GVSNRHRDVESIQLGNGLGSAPFGHQYLLVGQLVLQCRAFQPIVVDAVAHDVVSCSTTPSPGSATPSSSYSGSIFQAPSSPMPTCKALSVWPCAMAASTTSASAGVRLLPSM